MVDPARAPPEPLPFPTLALLLLAAPQDARPQPHELRAPNTLTELERAAGWQLLFDGRTTRGWQAMGGGAFPDEGWDVEDGCLHLAAPGAGDVVTEAQFEDFELVFEWKVAEGTNSGVKYRVPLVPGRRAMLGPEYQVLDDSAAASGNGVHDAAALYALYSAEEKVLRPAGTFNESRIVARGDRIEHWLNGVRVLACVIGSDDWNARLARSKFAKVENFARQSGAIGFQDHGGEVWFRSVRLRDFGRLPGQAATLSDGHSTSGWRELGDAVYEVDGDEIFGYVGGGGQSFLVSEERFGDFLFEVDLRTEAPGNSGIQVRSQIAPTGRLFGYQIEVDPSARSWSGGLYDEGRRGWLDNLADNPAGRAAFRHGEWNRYRIECVGPWIRASVNGVPTADYLDGANLEGHLALQVHSGNNTKVRWRGARLQHFGVRNWLPITFSKSDAVATSTEGPSLAVPANGALRLHYRPQGAHLAIGLAENEVPEGVASHAFLFEPTSEAGGEREDRPNVLEIFRLANRLVINRNGRQVLERFDFPSGGALRLQLRAQPHDPAQPGSVELESMDTLSPAELDPPPFDGSPRPLFADLDDTQAMAEIRRAFRGRNPGYDVTWRSALRALEPERRARVLFVQNGSPQAEVDGSAPGTGDLFVLPALQPFELQEPIGALVFTIPGEPPRELPRWIQPDWDESITDTPGGCATEEGAYRRILLTWLEENGPYVWHAINAHRVRITDSFTHYHPIDGGFDEFYLVQMSRPGAALLTSTKIPRIESADEVGPREAADLLERHELHEGQLVYLPRGVAHRGVGGALVQVITVPGFRPGAEIGLDHHLRSIAERHDLDADVLPYHEAASTAPVVR